MASSRSPFPCAVAFIDYSSGRTIDPQFYSRIGFVHQFRPLDPIEIQDLLDRHWAPLGVTLPDEPFAPEVLARLIRITGGNFQMLTRLLTHIEQVLSVNDLLVVSIEIVEAASPTPLSTNSGLPTW